jgi:cytochrome d ubiquinol oxidase subunit II
MMRTEGDIYHRVRAASLIFALLAIVTFALAGVWVANGIDGYRIVTMPSANTAFGPLAKTVEAMPGAWLWNYAKHPWTVAAPIAAFGGALLGMAASFARRPGLGFVLSSVAVAAVVLTAGFAMFPFIMPSTSDPASSLTVWDAVSSRHTLQIMFWVVVLFLPLVLLYTGWVYRVMRGTITERQVREDGHSLY